MLNNFFTISSVAKYFNDNITGFMIKEVYSQEKNRFLIELANENDIDLNKTLEFSIEKDSNYLIEKNNFSKAKKNYADVFQEIYGKKIIESGIYNNDRVIFFKLENDYGIIFTFFSNRSNCFITEREHIINSFKDREEFIKKEVKDVISIKTISDNRGFGAVTVNNYLRSNYRKLGNVYQKEVIFNVGLREDELIDENKIDLLKTEIEKTISKFNKTEYIIYRDDKGIILSLINLNHKADAEKESFSNVNQLIQEYLKLKFRSEKINNYKASKLNEYFQKISNIEKKISGIGMQLSHCENSDILRKYGDMIIQNSYLIHKGESVFVCKDESGAEIQIKLKENLTPVENAKYYFDKYKKQKASVNILKVKVDKLESEKLNLTKELERAGEEKDIKKIMKEEKNSGENKNDETSRFRKFKINEKYEVWVGKDSISNDLLTTKYSAQNDLWFHVRGASGSHTVLKVLNKKEEVSKEDIYAAGSIAAYYSKARNSSSVPVAYCEKKYVKKKKGFKAGSVLMEREKVIFVKPSLPEEK